MNSLVNKLLRRRINAWQMAGFTLANLCGMAIVLTAVQFFADLKPLMTGSDSFMREGHIVVTKKVSSLGTIIKEKHSFSEAEIADLGDQPFVKKMGRYTPAEFTVFATIGGGSMGMKFATEMFFEAVPDEFLDVDLSKWKYDPAGDMVPIILPRTYLNLYNFGFATSQGLPTVSEEIVGAVSISLRLSGSAGTEEKIGRVVAFSRRLNTILVPQAFINDMNAKLSPGKKAEPARLIVCTDNPADERIARYLEDNGYDTETADADASKAAGLMRIITSIVLIVGLVISVLAFYVLLLSIFLLLQKHTEKIDNLLLIGYTTWQVAKPFHVLTVVLNALVLCGAMLVVVIVRNWYLPLFGELYSNFEASDLAFTLMCGLAIFALVSTLNFVAITRKVKAIWHIHE